MKKFLPFILIIIAFLINASVYTVTEMNQVVITQFQKPVKEVRKAGLYFKLPFIQEKRPFDKRLLDYDSDPEGIVTKDKKNLVIDNYSKWRIINPLKFFTTVKTIKGAQSRLDDIIYSELRLELGKHNLIDIVSSTRTEIMAQVTEIANTRAIEYGIEIVDVRIKRADLPKENASSVYGRMRTERHRIAREYRSRGKEEALKIKAETDKERTILLADAYKQEQILEGQGDALAIKIYADALEADPEFYSFTRSLEAYKKSLKRGTTIILSPKSDFLKYLDNIK